MKRSAVDFAGTSQAVTGNINCLPPVTAAAVFYAIRCLMAEKHPRAGVFEAITIMAEPGSFGARVSPERDAAGNVETSMRIVT